ncbi:hypothetical protein ACFYWD_00085 [Streptomyces sp. NPDC003781]|uniref:hypothetical protein n=1 Tax=Streptomyces sp. NPDC003781 TaxID=3364686 RepID=UPI0036B2582E
MDAGRQAAAARRRADSEACRQRVLDVIAGMRKTRGPLSDAEITRRAAVNSPYLQRHRDLKAEAEAVRAHLAGDRTRAATAARQDAGLAVENRMLLEQNTALRRDLEEARAVLRAVRVRTSPPTCWATSRRYRDGTLRSRLCATNGSRPWPPCVARGHRTTGTAQRRPTPDGGEHPAPWRHGPAVR